MRYPNGRNLFIPAESAELLENEMDRLRAITGSDITLADLVACAPAMAKRLFELNALDVSGDTDDALN